MEPLEPRPSGSAAEYTCGTVNIHVLSQYTCGTVNIQLYRH